MYKVLIADDEDIIRQGIAGLLKQDAEFEVVAQAEDGETALDMAIKFMPDLLFVDVNMPFLNGLQFIEKLEGILKGAIIIIITGYDDFAYARQALRLGVFDYILKPIMEDVFYAALDRAKEELQKINEQSRYLKWAKILFEKNKDRLTENFLNDWLEGHFSVTEAEERIKFLKLQFPDPFGILIASLDYKNSTEVGDEWNDDLLYYAAENIGQELFQPFSPVLLCRDSGGNLIIISSCRDFRAWQAAAKQFCQLLECHLPVRAAAVQYECKNYGDLPVVYGQALGKISEMRGTPQLVKDVQNYIDNNYRYEKFSLQDAASAFHVSPQYLSRMFRHSMGITFVDYVTRERIRRAIELLGDEEMKIYEIAELTGYSNQHYFSSAFKKVLGISPAEYRKSGRAN